MKIALVTGRFPQLSETFVYRHAVGLAARGHEVTVVARTSGDWSLYPDLLPPTLKFVALPPDTDLRSPRRAFELLRQSVGTTVREAARAKRCWQLCETATSSRMDALRQLARHLPFVNLDVELVHFEFLAGAVLYPLVGDLLDVPVVASCRGQDIHTLELREEAERERYLERLRRVDAIHCVSEELAREVRRLTNRTRAVWVNRPAVDADHIEVERSRNPGAVRIIASGRLTWVKGYDYLFTAFAELVRRGVEFTAKILGEGELWTSLKFSIFDLGLGDRVELLGGVSSTKALDHVRDADVFVLPSVAEGISNAVLEAMAAGLPIVTTNAGGMSEAVTNGVEGFVVPIRDALALADSLEQLVNEPALRMSMGDAARLRVETDFQLDRQVTTFETMYRSLRPEAREP